MTLSRPVLPNLYRLRRVVLDGCTLVFILLVETGEWGMLTRCFLPFVAPRPDIFQTLQTWSKKFIVGNTVGTR
jgi:hypothetical protein